MLGWRGGPHQLRIGLGREIISVASWGGEGDRISCVLGRKTCPAGGSVAGIEGARAARTRPSVSDRAFSGMLKQLDVVCCVRRFSCTDRKRDGGKHDGRQQTGHAMCIAGSCISCRYALWRPDAPAAATAAAGSAWQPRRRRWPQRVERHRCRLLLEPWRQVPCRLPLHSLLGPSHTRQLVLRSRPRLVRPLCSQSLERCA